MAANHTHRTLKLNCQESEVMRRTVHAMMSNKVLMLSEADVRRCLPMSAAIEANRLALGSLRTECDGGAVVPPRTSLRYDPPRSSDDKSSHTTTTTAPDWTLFKPAALYQSSDESGDGVEHSEDVCMGMKVVSVRANNPSRHGKPSVPAMVLLLNAETGELASVMGGTYLTAARTAAGSAIATQLCLTSRSRLRASNNDKAGKEGGEDQIGSLVVFGAGLQAEQHIRALQCLYDVAMVTIVNRTLERAEKLKAKIMNDSSDGSNAESGGGRSSPSIHVTLLGDTDDVEKVVRGADVIVTATNATDPLFRGEWAKVGCHVNGVGSYTPSMRELDEAMVNRCNVLLDTEEAREVGDLIHLTKDSGNNENGQVVGLLGDVISERISLEKVLSSTAGQLVVESDENALSGTERRQHPLDCTFFKSVGTAIQDIVTARAVAQRALELSIGTTVPM